MEKIRISSLKAKIAEAKTTQLNSVDQAKVVQIELALKVCPPQFLRISKMYNVILGVIPTNNNRSRYGD